MTDRREASAAISAITGRSAVQNTPTPRVFAVTR